MQELLDFFRSISIVLTPFINGEVNFDYLPQRVVSEKLKKGGTIKQGQVI